MHTGMIVFVRLGLLHDAIASRTVCGGNLPSVEDADCGRRDPTECTMSTTDDTMLPLEYTQAMDWGSGGSN
jgi:hypothetical protein